MNKLIELPSNNWVRPELVKAVRRVDAPPFVYVDTDNGCIPVRCQSPEHAASVADKIGKLVNETLLTT